MKLRVIRLGLLIFVAMTLVATPVLAYLYRAPITVTEGSGNSYTQLPLSVTMNNDWLASNGFMDADALDTRVQTLAGSNKPWMIADDRTLFSVPVPSNSQTNLYFVTGEASAAQMNIITGYNGYITTADAAALELGNQFEVEYDGYLDTSEGYGWYLEKNGAFDIQNTAVGEITSNIYTTASAYPVIEATDGGYNGSATNHTVDLPAGITQGEMLLIVFAIDNWNTAVNTWPTGWTELFDVGNGVDVAMAAAWKIADGTEGSSVTVVAAASRAAAYTTYRISGHNRQIEVDSYVTGTSVNPDPPSLTPSWGNTTTLWIAVEGNDGSVTASGYPATYTSISNDTGANVGVASAYKEVTAAAEDPGTFTLSGSEQWIATTIGVMPAYDVDKTVVITGISSGEHTLTVTADTVDFYISVDSSVPAGAETVALAGSSVPDNSNDYILLNDYTAVSGSTVPYAEYITIDVGGAEVVKYQPVTMIISATLPDLTGAAQNGTFTWGSNPSGVSVSLGSMTSSGDAVSTPTDTSTDDLLPVVGGTDWNEAPAISGALLTNPLRPIVTAISDNTTLSERQVWVWLGIVFVAFITVLVGSRVRGHHLITGIAAGAAISLMVVFTIFPVLTLLVAALAIFGGMVSERSPSL